MEAQEHIGTHQQDQLRIGVLLLHLLHRHIAVARSFPAQFDVADLKTGAVCHGNAQHFQPLLRCGRSCRNLLMGRNPVGDQNQPGQAQCRHRLFCRLNMPHMGRVKGSAVNTDSFHDAPLLSIFIRENAI